jgi:hypothetical protein
MGTNTAYFRPLRGMALAAVALLAAVITASRTSCGEALACRPDQRHFRLTVIVR